MLILSTLIDFKIYNQSECLKFSEALIYAEIIFIGLVPCLFFIYAQLRKIKQVGFEIVENILASVTREKSPNVYKSSPKLISLEK